VFNERTEETLGLDIVSVPGLFEVIVLVVEFFDSTSKQAQIGIVQDLDVPKSP
jgi:hypothetical protein